MTKSGEATFRIDLESSISVLLTFLSNRMTASASATYRNLFGLGVLEFRLLVMLAVEPDIPPARICEVMGLDNGAVSRALRGLESRGLVMHRPDQRHSAYKLWSLTEEGARVQDKAAPLAASRDALLLEAFSQEEREQLILMMRRMLERVDKLRFIDK